VVTVRPIRPFTKRDFTESFEGVLGLDEGLLFDLGPALECDHGVKVLSIQNEEDGCGLLSDSMSTSRWSRPLFAIGAEVFTGIATHVVKRVRATMAKRVAGMIWERI